MKTLLLLSALLASSAHSQAADLFTPTQRKEILFAIDKICADSWCEGDYNFQFNDFACNSATRSCYLSFQFIKEEENKAPELSDEQVCHFKNIKGFESVMKNEHTLANSFYSSLTECITDKESRIHF